MSKEPNLQRMSKEEIDEIKIDAYMSKEQTPIEKAYDLWLCEHPKKDYSYKAWTHRARAIEFSQFYTKAKVLEVLEREFLLANEEAEFYQLDEYYETEVKPKYEKNLY